MARRSRLLLALWLPIVLAQTPRVRAELECAQPLIEKGEVRSGRALSHSFRITNRGPNAVEVREVRPSCGCLEPKLEKRHLEPGESATLLLEVNTLTQPAGAHTWRVTLRYQTAGAEYDLPLYVSARIVTEISVEPPSLAIYTNRAIRHEVRVIDRRSEPLIVRAAPASSPHVRTHLGELHRNDAGHWVRSIEVEILADCPEGTHTEFLRICTSDPLYSELKVPFTIVKRARPPVQAAPAEVALTAPADQPLPARIVLLSAADDGTVAIERVEADHEAIACRWAQGPGHRATLKIRVDRTRIASDHLHSSVRVHLRGPAAQTITIPVHCDLH